MGKYISNRGKEVVGRVEEGEKGGRRREGEKGRERGRGREREREEGGKGSEGEREGGREGGREEGREGGREGGREEGRGEGGKYLICFYCLINSLFAQHASSCKPVLNFWFKPLMTTQRQFQLVLKTEIKHRTHDSEHAAGQRMTVRLPVGGATCSNLPTRQIGTVGRDAGPCNIFTRSIRGRE